ncbi:vanadium-dependent haloperoxidase [Thalassiella azotivora]
MSTSHRAHSLNIDRRSCLRLGALILGTAAASSACKPAATIGTRDAGRYVELAYDVAGIDGLTPVLAARFLAYSSIAAHIALTGEPLTDRLTSSPQLPSRPRTVAPDTAAAACASVLMPSLLHPPTPAGWAVLRNVTQQWLLEDEGTEHWHESHQYGVDLGLTLAHWAGTDGTSGVARPPLTITPGPGRWVPQSEDVTHQPIDPYISEVARPLVLATPGETAARSPNPFSLSPSSTYMQEVDEVRSRRESLSPDESALARFWADGRDSTGTPAGHWALIAARLAQTHSDEPSRVTAVTAVALYDAALACWKTKYDTMCARPRQVIHEALGDRTWEPLMPDPPFPEHTSGHSTMSAAAATVLEGMLGRSIAFTDVPRATGMPLAIAPRTFATIASAAAEASESRVLAGIHFPTACRGGFTQGEDVATRVLDRLIAP